MRHDDLDDELASHLEFQARKHMAAGMSEADARRQARAEFGGLDLTKEQCRDVDPWQQVDRLRRDFRYAVRSLRKSPIFTLIAVVILAAGIGATTGAFSVVDAVLYRPIGVSRPGELVRISTMGKQGRPGRLPSTILEPLRNSKWLAGACGFLGSQEGFEVNRTPKTVGVMIFSGDCFGTLGVATKLGRPLLPSDDQPGAAAAAVITGELWRRDFGARADAIGQTVQMPGVSFTIVGVAEDRFNGLILGFPTGIIIPLHQLPSKTGQVGQQAFWWVELFGRRAPGVSLQQATAGLAAQSAWLLENSVPPGANAARRKQYLDARLAIAPGGRGIDNFLRRRFGSPLLAIFSICAAILAIACVNLAGLILARAWRRRKEIGVRLALGASRRQVAGMLALESTLLVAAGAWLAIPCALAVDRLVAGQGTEMFGVEMQLGLDQRSILFFVAITIGSAVALAGASAWQARRLCRGGWLQDSGVRVVHGYGLAQKALIGAQIALTLALVCAAGMFGSSLRGLYGINLGVDLRHVWDVKLASRPMAYEQFDLIPYYRDLIGQVENIPGLRGAVVANFVPFYDLTQRSAAALIESADPGQELDAHTAAVTDGFFPMMGMRMVAGSDFRRDLPPGAEPEAIVSQSLAARWGGAGALLGRHIRMGTAAEYQRMRVVGVTGDAELDLANPSAYKPFAVYVNSWQHPNAWAGYSILLLKTAGGGLPAAGLRQVVDRLGRDYVDRTRPLESERDAALVEDRTTAYLSAAFGALALALAATGLFGLLSYQVANRTGEIGIRMALGARRGQIQWLIVRQIAGLVGGGAAAGLALALLAGRAVSGMLFGVNASDPKLLVGSVGVLGATALLAAWLPARRAASVDPQVALRHE